ncbi:hypothetical protein AAG906_027333 [Vitis piasezkii]
MLIEATPWYAHIANYLVTGECVLEQEQQGSLVIATKKHMKTTLLLEDSYEVVLKFLKENIFSRFGVPKAIISDGSMENVPSPVEVQYKAWWAIKALNMDLNRAKMKRFLDLNEMEELRNDTYNNSNIAKQRLKMWHDQLRLRTQFATQKPISQPYEFQRPLCEIPTTSLESSIHHIPPKRAKTSGPGETSRHAQLEPQDPTDSQRPSGIATEAIIKRPMVTAPPIEGNLDCRARPFHSELYFDIEAMEFFYPRMVMDFYQSMTTQGAQSPTAIHFSIDGGYPRGRG